MPCLRDVLAFAADHDDEFTFVVALLLCNGGNENCLVLAGHCGGRLGEHRGRGRQRSAGFEGLDMLEEALEKAGRRMPLTVRLIIQANAADDGNRVRGQRPK